MRHDLDGLVTRSDLLTLQVLHVALPLGAITFAVVIGAMAALGFDGQGGEWTSGDASTPEEAVSLLRTLSLAHLVLAVGLALLLPKVLPRHRSGAEEHPRVALGRVRASYIIRLIVLEGAAMFGLTVCLVGVVRGVMVEHPVYWLNVASSLVLLAASVLAFPSRERVEEQLGRSLTR